MRVTHLAVLLLLTAACGKKAPPVAATEVPEAAPAPDATPPAAPEPEAPPPLESNASFTAKLTYADGRTVQGNVVRVERSDDFYADRGWTDNEMKLTVTLDADGKGRDAAWQDIGTVDVSYGGSSDIDCSYDSSMSPLMYMCVLKTTARVTTTDGASWDAPDRYRWRLHFEGGDTAEFHLYKLPARQQTANRDDDEDYALYETLQKQVIDDATKAIQRIEITP